MTDAEPQGTLVHGFAVPGELVARLEAASVGSRELDVEIGLTLDGFFVLPPRYDGDAPRYAYRDKGGTEVHPGQGGTMLVWHYTTSLDAALALAERVLPGAGWSIRRNDWGVTAEVYPYEPDTRTEAQKRGFDMTPFVVKTPPHGSAPTPALALCIAILGALKATPASSEGTTEADSSKVTS